MTTLSESGGLGSGSASSDRIGTAWLFVSFAAAIAVFWSGLISLGEAWSVPEYSHGPLIPILSLYLFLRQLREKNPTAQEVKDRWVGIPVVIVGLLIGLMGDLARIPDITTYALLIWLYGMLLVTFGWRNGWIYWPPVLHLIYMLPLPNFIYWQVSIQLQFISSELGVWSVSYTHLTLPTSRQV